MNWEYNHSGRSKTKQNLHDAHFYHVLFAVDNFFLFCALLEYCKKTRIQTMTEFPMRIFFLWDFDMG